MSQSPPGSPRARRSNLRELIHGVEVADPYRWLEDPISDETRAWLAAQRDYTSRILDTPIRPSLRTRLALIMQVDEIGVPIVRNGSYFYARRFADRQQPVICHRSGHAGVERILIDPQISSSDSFTSAEIQAVSNDGKLVAYGLRRGGEDELEIRVLEVRGERELVDLLPRGRYFNLAWNHQGSGFYYFVHTGGKSCVRFHRLGTLPHADTEVFEASPDRGIRLHATYDGRYLILTVIRGGSGSPTDLYFLTLGRDERAVPIVADTDSVYEPAYVGDALVLHTNLEAPNWRVMRVSFADPRRASWSEIVSERAAPMQSLAAVGGRLFLSYLEDVRSRIRIVDINGSSLGEIDLPAAGTAGPLMGGWQDPEAFSLSHHSTFRRLCSALKSAAACLTSGRGQYCLTTLRVSILVKSGLHPKTAHGFRCSCRIGATLLPMEIAPRFFSVTVASMKATRLSAGRSRSFGCKREGFLPWQICAAAANSESDGIVRGSLNSSKMSLTISPRLPNIWFRRDGLRLTISRRSVRVTADCSWALQLRSVRSCSALQYRGHRCSTWFVTHAIRSARSGFLNSVLRTIRISLRIFMRTRLITMLKKARIIRQLCSSLAKRILAAIRCTRARWQPRCSGPRALRSDRSFFIID